MVHLHREIVNIRDSPSDAVGAAAISGSCPFDHHGQC